LNEASNSQISRSLSPSLLREDKQNNESVELLLNLAARNIFPQIEVMIDKQVKKYTPILNWFNFENDIKKPVSKHLNFNCIICGKTVIGELGKPGNKYKHLKTHKDGAEWSRLYEICKAEVKSKPKKSIDRNRVN
jgi:hypothetical protein